MLSIEKLNSNEPKASNQSTTTLKNQASGFISLNTASEYSGSSQGFYLQQPNEEKAVAELSALFDNDEDEEEEEEEVEREREKPAETAGFLSKQFNESQASDELIAVASSILLQQPDQSDQRKISTSSQHQDGQTPKKSIHFEPSVQKTNSIDLDESKNGYRPETNHVEFHTSNSTQSQSLQQHLSKDQLSSLSRKSSAHRLTKSKQVRQDLPNIVDISSLAVTNSNNINEISLERLNISLASHLTPKTTASALSQQQISQAIMQEFINNQQQQQSQHQHQQQLGYQMRRERSLDRAPAIDNYAESGNIGPATLRRSQIFNQSAQQQPGQPTFSNSSLFLNNLGQQLHASSNQMSTSMLGTSTAAASNSKSNTHVSRTHHRSNSILNASTATTNALNSMLNAGAGGGSGMRGSGRALSSNSYSTQNLFMQREPSSNSIKSLNPSSNANFISMQLGGPSTNESGGQGANNSAMNQAGGSSKLNFIKDLQIRLMDVQKECYYLRCELDSCQQKLSSSMQSIKQFWSPELKRERQMRKEETAKYALLVEQYKLLQNQYQTLLESYEQQTLSIQQMQLQLQQAQQQHQQDDMMMQSSASNKHLLREKNMLKKTIGELEMRISAQKQTLAAKDETIKKLFQLVKTVNTAKYQQQHQSSSNSNSNEQQTNLFGTNSDLISEIDSIAHQIETSTNTNILINEQNQLRERLHDEERKNLQLQQFVQQLQQQKNSLITQLAVSTSTSSNLASKMTNDQFIQNLNGAEYMLDEKDARTKQLESQVHQLQEELNATKASLQRSVNNLSSENFDGSNNAAMTQSMISNANVNSSSCSPHHPPASHHPSQAQLELLKSNEKFLKEKIETLKFDLSRKDTELAQLKTKYETCESKEKDLQHYLTLLKESISTKDQQITMQQSEVNELRTRLREKESFIEKKNQQLQSIQMEKHQRDSDIGEIRDQMDIKERKISVLNRKIDNLEEQLKDKEMQISTLRNKLNSTSSSIFQTNVLQTLEQTLEHKEKIIEKLTKELSSSRQSAFSSTQSIQPQTQPQQQLSPQMAAVPVQAPVSPVVAHTPAQPSARELELVEQIETLNITIKELNEKIEMKNKEIQDYQNETFDLKDEVESFKTQLLRKDSHVNSLELSLTQKNEEIDMIEEKLTRLAKQQQQQMATSSSQSNSNLVEIENLKKLNAQLQKELQSKEIQIQQLTTELVALKELIDDFEEQKQVLKSKLEQQQVQFGELEKQYEQTTSEFETQLREQERMFDEQLTQLKANNKENLKQHQEIDEMEKQERLEQLDKLGSRVQDLEEALRESVSITAEREFVMAQQKKKTEKLELDNKTLQEEIEALQKLLNEQKCEYDRFQSELYQRDEQLQKLEEEKVKEMDELLITKQEILLSTISEKDAIIGTLEFDKTGDAKANQIRIQRLNDEKDYLHQKLKELNERRMKLMQDYMKAKDAKDKVKSFTVNQNTANDEDGIYG